MVMKTEKEIKTGNEKCLNIKLAVLTVILSYQSNNDTSKLILTPLTSTLPYRAL